MLKAIDTVATNVPGMDRPVYLAGAEVTREYAFAPPVTALEFARSQVPVGLQMIDVASELDGFDILATGSPPLLRDINDYLQGGLTTLGAPRR